MDVECGLGELTALCHYSKKTPAEAGVFFCNRSARERLDQNDIFSPRLRLL